MGFVKYATVCFVIPGIVVGFFPGTFIALLVPIACKLLWNCYSLVKIYKQIKELCNQAKKYDFASVCVNPTHIALCKKELEGSDVKVCTVIGFPNGYNTTAVKVFETKDAIANGADEIDMVINVGALKDKRYQEIEDEIRQVHEACNGKILKVIIETCLLTEEEKLAWEHGEECRRNRSLRRMNEQHHV